MSLNKISPSVTTASVLITDDRLVTANGSNDAIPQMTRDINNEIVDAALEIQSTQGALLFPRMTNAEMNALLPYNGMIVYNTTSNSFYGYAGGVWGSISNAGAGAPTNATYITQIADGALPNAQPLSLLSTGLMKSTTGTGVVSIAVSGTDYVVPGGAPFNDKFILQQPDLANLPNAQSISTLATGLLKGTTGTGVISTAVAGTDYVVPGGVPFNDRFILQTPDFTNLPNSQPLSTLTTGIMKSTTGTGVVSIAVPGTDYFVPGSAPYTDKFILQQPDLTNLPNAQALSTLSTGIMKSTTGTGVVSIAVAGTDYVAPGTVAPLNATYITQTPSASLTNEQPLSLLSTGIMKSANGSGVVSIATPGVDYYAPSFPTFIYDTQPSAGTSNLFIGTNTATDGSGGTRNTGVGFSVFQGLSGATEDSTAFGQSALTQSSASQCSAFGSFALAENTEGVNDAFGFDALRRAGPGTFNAAFGNSVLQQFQGSAANSTCGFGHKALFNLKEGERNCAFGYLAATSPNVFSDNAIYGANAYQNGQDSQNSIFGSQAMVNSSSGAGNCTFGYNSLANANTNNACAFGVNALSAASNPEGVNAFGANALLSNADGSHNNAFGTSALQNVTTGFDSCGFGHQVLFSCIDGNQNVAVGNNALFNLNGNSNVAVGYNAGGSQPSLTSCCFIGHGADASTNGISNAIAIGANASVASSNTIVLGNGATLRLKGTVSGFTGTEIIRQQNGFSIAAAGSATLNFPVPTSSPRQCVSVTATINFISQNGTTCAGSFAPTTMSAFYNGAVTGPGVPPVTTLLSIGTTTGASAVWSVSGSNIRLTLNGVTAQATTWMVTTEQFAVTTSTL